VTGAGETYPTPRVAWYTLGILILLYTSSFIDRLIISLLLEPIKADLQVSDTAMGLLVGTAFAMLYTVMSLPFGWLADRFSRKKIVAFGAALWSVCTIMCGLAGTYWQLFLARIAVGTGAAALTPAAYSMIGDLFNPRIRPFAMGVYVMSISIGTGLAFMIGGVIVGLVAGANTITVPLLGELRPWQFAFVAAGLPGLPLAIVMLTVREPTRLGLLREAGEAPHAIPIRDVVRFVRQRWRSYAAIILPSCLLTMLSYGLFSWLPAYFIRVHGWAATDTGLIFGASVLVSGVAATLSGGALCSFFVARGRKDAHIIVLLLAAVGVLPFAILGPLASNQWVALALLTGANFFGSCWGGPVAAGLQALTPNQMRAQVSALYLFSVNITGLALGPLMVGVFTDQVFGQPADIKYSLALTGLLLTPPAIVMLIVGRKHFRQGVIAAAAWEA
jgi:MFS family permease